MAGPGKSRRKGISLASLMKQFPDDETAEKWFIEQRWGDQIACPKCGSHNIQVKPNILRCLTDAVPAASFSHGNLA